jgi:L-lysine exporter family protein LysE/ArgO
LPINSFFEGFLLGIGAAVPIGAINILIMNTALKNYKSAVSIGFGAMSADIVYLSLILLGIATFLNNPFILNILGVLGSGFLAYMAYLIFNNRNNKLDTISTTTTKKNLIKFYFQGFALTFINPYTIAFWLSIAGYTANKNLDPYVTILGMFTAIVLWITLMPYFVHKSKHRISEKVSYFISLGSSFILVGFAVSLFVNMFV